MVGYRFDRAPPLLVGLLTVLVFYVAGETLLARFRYRHGLMNQVHQRKTKVLGGLKSHQLEVCGDVMADASHVPESCVGICNAARDLAGLRRQHLSDIREKYFVSARLAEAFDAVRGVSQETRAEKLLEKKPCLKLIESVDKSNMLVDYFCAGILCVFYFVAYLCMPFVEGQVASSAPLNVLLSTICTLIPILVQPLWAIIGAVLATFLPQGLMMCLKPYTMITSLVSRLPLKFKSVVIMLFGFLFLVASSNTQFMVMLFEHLGLMAFAALSLCEGGTMVIDRSFKAESSLKSD